jgi:hypothetical protein
MELRHWQPWGTLFGAFGSMQADTAEAVDPISGTWTNACLPRLCLYWWCEPCLTSTVAPPDLPTSTDLHLKSFALPVQAEPGLTMPHLTGFNKKSTKIIRATAQQEVHLLHQHAYTECHCAIPRGLRLRLTKCCTAHAPCLMPKKQHCRGYFSTEGSLLHNLGRENPTICPSPRKTKVQIDNSG